MSGPVMLVVLDGFGLGDGGPNDSTAAAQTPFFEQLRNDHPMAQVETSGEAVGLPPGQMGNSEVGHMTLGAGRIIDQDMTRISKAFAEREIGGLPGLREAFALAEKARRPLHLLGLVSDGGVHSHIDHLIALLAECGRRGVEPVVHAFLDGRDTPPSSGLQYIEQLLPHVEAAGGRIATVSGRYYAMDRDHRWERIQLAYDALVKGQGREAADARSAIELAYARRETDEFVLPTVVAGGCPIEKGDPVLFFNFRADRARELTNAITGVRSELFEGELQRQAAHDPGCFVCLTEYDSAFDLPVAFSRERPPHILAEEVAMRGLTQLRIAETEKYAHVTFFFNCGLEDSFPGEERVLVPSPRDVPTYDHKPEMSAHLVTERLLERVREGDYAFILINFANPDMIGHTGILPAAVKAVETIDACLERVCEAVLQQDGQLLITADHGNCEQMVDPQTGEPHTAHTTNPVPIWWVTRDAGDRELRNGGLADVAPTVLELLELPVPAAMSGASLLVHR